MPPTLSFYVSLYHILKGNGYLLDVNTFVAQSYIQYFGVVSILLFIQSLFHQLQVTIYSVAQQLFAVFLGRCCTRHFGVEEFADVGHFFVLLAVQVQVLAQLGYIDVAIPLG